MSEQSLIIRESPDLYPVPDEGLHSAVCVDAVDLVELETPWGTKHKVSLIFELETESEEGKRFIVGKRFNKSLNEKSSLRKFFEKWQGEKFSPDQLKRGIDLEAYVGRSATLFIVQNETEERTYANIASILPLRDSAGNVQTNGITPSGAYTRAKDREDYKPPEDYAKEVNGTQ